LKEKASRPIVACVVTNFPTEVVVIIIIIIIIILNDKICLSQAKLHVQFVVTELLRYISTDARFKQKLPTMVLRRRWQANSTSQVLQQR